MISTPSSRYLPPAEYYLAPEEVEAATEVLSSVVPNENEDSATPVIDTVMKLAEDAVGIIKDLEPGTDVTLSNCAVPVGEVERMLHIFAENVESALPILQEILNVGSGLATADTEGKTRIGAELLILLESVLETIVPFQVSY